VEVKHKLEALAEHVHTREREQTSVSMQLAEAQVRLRIQGGKGRGRIRIQVHCISGPCHPPQVGGWLGFIVIRRVKIQTKCYRFY
jgi:hypothetical protein